MFKARSIRFWNLLLQTFSFYLLSFSFYMYLSAIFKFNQLYKFWTQIIFPLPVDFYRCIHPHRFNFRHYPIAFIVMLGINFRFGGCLFLTFSLAIEILGRQRIREGPQPATETQSATRHDFNIQQFRERGHCRVVHLPGKFII